MKRNLFELAEACLHACDPDDKCERAAVLHTLWHEGQLSLASSRAPRTISEPGRPPLPALVHPSKVPRRNVQSPEGRAALVHALTHIEFNAVNLAIDAIYRFRDLPRTYYADWLRVAREEAAHFKLLRERLAELGHDYGDFPAHGGLWDMAVRTSGDVLLRMAVVPRVLEARGLDVTPGMIKRLERVGDTRTCEVLTIILRDEIEHVAIGSRWFDFICGQRGVDSESTFRAIVAEHVGGALRGPFDRELRRRAGFSERELAALEVLGQSR